MKTTLIGIPIYNESKNIHQLVETIFEIILPIKEFDFKLLLIDDGSTDNSLQLVKNICENNSMISYISFSRNFGHQAAVTAILDHCEEDILIIMDADLQDPPELIKELVSTHLQGYDIVYTYRIKREGSTIKKFSYYLFYRMLNLISKVQVNVDSGDYVLLNKKAVLELRKLKEYHKFHRGLRSWIGFQSKGVGYVREDRKNGTPGYSYRKLFKLAFDGLFSFSLVPLRAGYIVGLFACMLSILFSAYYVFQYFYTNKVPTGFTSLVMLISFVFGVHMSFLGIVAEYIGRIYEQSKNRPEYIINEKSY